MMNSRDFFWLLPPLESHITRTTATNANLRLIVQFGSGTAVTSLCI
jgi:hypothetical protein